MDTSLEDRIRARAYELWESEGRPPGRDQEHWNRASQEMQSDGNPESAGIAPSGGRSGGIARSLQPGRTDPGDAPEAAVDTTDGALDDMTRGRDSADWTVKFAGDEGTVVSDEYAGRFSVKLSGVIEIIWLEGRGPPAEKEGPASRAALEAVDAAIRPQSGS